MLKTRVRLTESFRLRLTFSFLNVLPTRRRVEFPLVGKHHQHHDQAERRFSHVIFFANTDSKWLISVNVSFQIYQSKDHYSNRRVHARFNVRDVLLRNRSWGAKVVRWSLQLLIQHILLLGNVRRGSACLLQQDNAKTHSEVIWKHECVLKSSTAKCRCKKSFAD